MLLVEKHKLSIGKRFTKTTQPKRYKKEVTKEKGNRCELLENEIIDEENIFSETN